MPEHLSSEEQRAVEKSKEFYTHDSGYFREQSTRPQTIAYALSDSPVAVAMWIYEKFPRWTDNQGNPEDTLSVDRMLDNISLYWFTNTGASSVRLYWERQVDAIALKFAGPKLDLPVAAVLSFQMKCTLREYLSKASK